MNKNHFAILMAGGVGSRFWPVSTKQFPKQFHDMLGTGETLIQRTFHRLAKFIPAKNIFILTNEAYEDLVKEQLKGIKDHQVVLEPAMRNTAPCILYAAMKIKKINERAMIVVAPSDHWIEDEEAFVGDVKESFKVCEEPKTLMTMGIQPTFPNTGYGYIEYVKDPTSSIKKVKQFTEKPDYKTAKQFLEARNYVWNSGIFMWSAKSIIRAFRKNLPEMYALFLEGEKVYNTSKEWEFIKNNYFKAENISIDYGIMEKSDKVKVIKASFDWNDLGTWGALYDKLDHDTEANAAVNGKTVFLNATNNMVRTSNNKLVVIKGLNEYIVVDKEDVLLICPKREEQNIKKIVQIVKEDIGEEFV